MSIFRVKGHFRTWFKVIGYYLCVVAVLLIIFKLVVSGIARLFGVHKPDIVPGAISSVELMIFWLMLFTALGVTLIYRRFIDGKRPLYSLGLDPGRAPLPSVYGLVTGVVLISIVYLIIVILGGIKLGYEGTVFTRPGTFAIAVFALIPAAAAEELLMRGYPIKVIDEQWNRWAAVLITAVTFGMLHVLNIGSTFVGTVNVILAGILLGLVYLMSGSLWYAIWFHIGWNFAQSVLFGMGVSGVTGIPSILGGNLSGPALINGGSFGLEGSLVATAVEAGAILLMLFDKFPLFKFKTHPVAE
jgi:membrane protease YdiL (CAAX protease family)